MSELKTYKMVDEKYCTDCVCVIPSEVYLKSEADKVIAEKDKKIAELIEKNKRLARKDIIMASNAIKDVYKELRHQKYKRCLAMARWCERNRIDAANYRIPRKKWDFYYKWHKRWLKLAEQFKEAK